MDILSIQKNIHTAPRKLMLVADLVRKMSPERAVVILRFVNKAAAPELSKAIRTALANAKQANLDADKLSFKKLEINQGLAMKRMRPAGRGNRRLYKKRTSSIRIVLTDETVLNQRSNIKDQKPKIADLKNLSVNKQDNVVQEVSVSDDKKTDITEKGRDGFFGSRSKKTVAGKSGKSK